MKEAPVLFLLCSGRRGGNSQDQHTASKDGSGFPQRKAGYACIRKIPLPCLLRNEEGRKAVKGNVGCVPSFSLEEEETLLFLPAAGYKICWSYLLAGRKYAFVACFPRELEDCILATAGKEKLLPTVCRRAL